MTTQQKVAYAQERKLLASAMHDVAERDKWAQAEADLRAELEIPKLQEALRKAQESSR
jgi:hypothetical protein